MNNDAFAGISAMIAIPVKNEAERIGDCLLALSQQAGVRPGVVLLVNDTTDATLDAIGDVRPGLAMPVAVIEHGFEPGSGSAGAARRLAMAAADRLAPPGVPLLCTDADGRVAPDWVAANLRHLAAGADAVFGRAVIDPVEAERIPPALHEADRQECAYAALLDELAAGIDPEPWDPWPRHTEHSGASIAVDRAVFRRVGGMPDLALGEDRAFAAALLAADARVRHARDVYVVVSGRLLGRAVGGMADTIRRRLVAPDPFLDDALEPAADRVSRLHRRRALREECRAAGRPFGTAWLLEEAAHPPRPVRAADVAAETARAHSALRSLSPVVA